MKKRKRQPVVRIVTLSLLVALNWPTHAENMEEEHVDCGKQGVEMSKMSAEQRERMQAACREEKEHTDCGKSDMDMSNMTAQQREQMETHCQQMMQPSDTHSDKKPGPPPSGSHDTQEHAG
jgi:hypothetical protein